MQRWILKTFTTYRGEHYRPGEVLELTKKQVESYPLKALVDRGHLVRAGDDRGSTPLEADVFEEVDGIGPAYSEKIVELYGTVEELVEAGADRISEDISGVDLDKAEEIIEQVK